MLFLPVTVVRKVYTLRARHYWCYTRNYKGIFRVYSSSMVRAWFYRSRMLLPLKLCNAEAVLFFFCEGVCSLEGVHDDSGGGRPEAWRSPAHHQTLRGTACVSLPHPLFFTVYVSV